MKKNKQLLSTLVYIYLIIFTFIVLYYIYNKDIDYFTQSDEVKDEYNKIVSPNITKISDYIDKNKSIIIENNIINDTNKQRINRLMNNSITKINEMINTYISNI
jgi:predicted PurR-regulated permease PerM